MRTVNENKIIVQLINDIYSSGILFHCLLTEACSIQYLSIIHYGLSLFFLRISAK